MLRSIFDTLLYKTRNAFTPRKSASVRARHRLCPVIAQVQVLESRALLTVFTGDTGNNVINGTPVDDEVYGLGGADTLQGLEGNDLVRGGSGDDLLVGGNQGNDRVYGDGGNDAFVRGGSGDDVVYGDNPDDPTISGNDGVYGDAGNDQLFGGPGNDAVYGDNPDDPLISGNDVLYGNSGSDQLLGGPGNDSLDGGDDNDILIDDNARRSDVPFGNDTLFGGNGDDSIVSRGGIDTADGGAGADVFQYDAPADIVSNHTYLGTLTINNFVIGQDRILLRAWADRGFGEARLYDNFSKLLSNTEQVGNDTHIHLYVGVTSGYGATETTGVYEVAKIVLAGINKASLTPATFFVPELGNDPSNPEHFGPQVDRSGDNVIGDPFNADTGRSQTIRGAEGTDTINGRGGDDWINGDTGDDVIFGDAGNDVLHGGKGTDRVHGNDGNDVIIGDNDNDFLWGEDGDDELYGDRPGTADTPSDPRVDRGDTLRGGRGSNRLEGGKGDDIFEIEADAGTTDTIVDFSRITGSLETTNNDVIDLSAFTTIRTFEELQARAVQVGPDVRLDLPNKTVVIRNLTVGGLTPGMFRGSAGFVNLAPTDIILSPSVVAENAPSGTIVGSLSTVDPNGNNPYTLSLVSGSGSTDNASFTIDGNGNLVTSATFDFETKSSYTVRVRSIDFGGLAFEKALTITISNVNEVPTNIALSNSTVAENQPTGTSIGTFIPTDPDAGDTFSYSLVSGAGSTDNALFQITGNTLQTKAILDFEGHAPTYSIRVRMVDAGGLAFEKSLSVTVTNTNEGPTDISLPVSSVAENQPAGTTVGSLTTADPDLGDTFSYSLVTGAGSTDNALFRISGNTLQTNAVLDFESHPTYSIRIRTTDAGGLSFEKSFTVSATSIPDAPSNLSLSANTVLENEPANTVVGNLTTTDSDAGDTFGYSLVTGVGGTDNSFFKIVGNSLQTAAPLDFETRPVYSIRIRTTDSGSLFFEKTFTVSAINVNETPTNLTLSSNSVADAQPAGTSVGNFTTTDPDSGDTFTYTLVAGAGSTDNASFRIVGNTLQTNAILDAGVKPTYSIRVRTADAGGLWLEKSFTISLVVVDPPPTNLALSANSVAENQSAGTVIGNLSTTDATAGDTFTYALVSGSGSTDNALFRIVGNTLQTNAVLNFEVQSNYSVRIQTTDAAGQSFEKSFTIVATNVNEAPTNLNLSAQTVAENQPIGTVVGTLTTADPDSGDTFSYLLVTGAGSTDNSSFRIVGNALQTNAVLNFEAQQIYSIRLRTTDANGLSFEKMFTISITNINESPTSIEMSANTVPENQPVGTAIGNLTTTDPDLGDTFTYTLVGGPGSADNGLFQINGTTLQTKAVLNFETQTAYSIRIRTTDLGGLEFEKSFSISVTNVNEEPTNITLSANIVAENQPVGTAIGNLTTTDPDAGDTFSYILVSGSGSADNASFRIVGNTLQTSTSLNFEAQATYFIRIRTADAGGLAFEKSFTISATDIKETPTDLALSTNTVAENQPIGTTVGTFTTTDPDAGDTFGYSLVTGANSTDNALFQVIGNTLQTKAVLDFESQATYLVRVRTTDAGGLMFEKSFMVLATNVNEVPTDLTLSANTVAENQPAGTAIGNLTTTDPDHSDTSTYTLIGGTGSADNNLFRIVGNTLQTNAVLNFEAQQSYFIRIRTADAGGLVFEESFIVSATDVNEAPTDFALSANTVAENRPVETAIGNLTTTDPDSGDTFTYSLVTGTGSTDNALFQISGNTLQTNASLNFEAQQIYSIRIRTTDAGGLMFEKTLTVSATDINEDPTISSIGNQQILEDGTTGLLQFSIDDPETPASNLNVSAFSSQTGLVPNGSLILSGTGPNRGLTISPLANQFGTTTITILVDDGVNTSSISFTLTVTAVNDGPTITGFAPQSILEDNPTGALGFTIADLDNDPSGLTVTATSSDTVLIPNGNLTFSGTGANRSLIVTPAENRSGSATITVTVSDGSLSSSQTFQVTVTAVDDPTTIGLNPQALIYRVSGRKPVAIDSVATISDVDTPNLMFNGSSLQVAGQSVKDKLSILAANGIKRKGKNVVFNNTVIGTVSGGTRGMPLEVRLNGAATQNSVQALLRSIGFKAVKKGIGLREVHVQITNINGANTSPAARQIEVTL